MRSRCRVKAIGGAPGFMEIDLNPIPDHLTAEKKNILF
jgi:hypothetical protein